jgi:hypothetical protein
MKKTILCLSLIVILPGSFGQAAIPTKDALNVSPRVLEILNLPAENRAQVTNFGSLDYYKDYITVAFSEGQSMRLRWRALMMAAETHREKATPDLLKAATHKQWFMRNA